MVNKRYEIKITEFVDETTLTRRQWKPGAGTEGEANMGYTPQVETVENVEREIFKQSVDDLDLDAVIKAINNL